MFMQHKLFPWRTFTRKCYHAFRSLIFIYLVKLRCWQKRKHLNSCFCSSIIFIKNFWHWGLSL